MKIRPDLNLLAKDVYEANKAKGFHDEQRSNETLLMLVITELSEAIEADRKSRKADLKAYNLIMDGYTPEDSPISFEHSFKTYIKDSIEDKLADAVIRLLDYAGRFNNNNEYPSIIDLNKAKGCCVSVDRKEVFPDKIYEIVSWLTITHGSYFGYVNTGIFLIEHLCNQLGIDLWLHVEIKMKYNASRPHKHGKNY